MAQLDDLKRQRQDILNALSGVVRSGKRYKIGSHEKENLDIADLRELLDDIDAQIAAEERTPPLLMRTYQAYFQGR